VNRDQAYNLIRETFTLAFDKARFRNFAINLLNRIDESKTSAWKGPNIKDAFKDHVNYYERLGTFTSPDKEKLDVLIVHLTTESKLEHARTAIRNFVADHLKTRDEKDAALVAFVSPTEKQWRFSYVKMEYATVEKESGKVGVETRLTPARRFSYIVGEGESCHTAQTRFLNLLQNTQTDPKLADIEEVFSVEAVTKEFFKEYANLFGDIHKALEKLVENEKNIRDEFTAKSVSAVDFSKKLMGQIVFLYFLQKKGWLGVAKGQDWGSGPHDFLRRLANGEYGKYTNFFNDILEPLFYDTLATDRGHEAWCNRFKCRIPFLNGGLFEPLGGYDWKKIDIILPNRLFNNTEYVEEGVTGTGVLDVFDRYNFTVNEAEPLEKEVAIDPEMLGKVFENLIEENRRKGLGAYYTPREIVHYMCQESFINYLDTALNPQPVLSSEAKQSLQHNSEIASSQTPLLAITLPKPKLVPREDIEKFVHLGDQAAHYEAARMSGTKSYKPELPRSIETHARLIDEKLTDITICDPAVGSGAFLVGMMTEIVRARSSLTPYFNDIHERTPYHFKRHAIQNCLYGVDIDPGAVEIAKLRLWLSLVVDEEDIKRIKPLPNLDYKIVMGNSLLGLPFKSQRLGKIEELKQKIFDETDHVKKAQLKAQVDELLAQVFAASKRSLGYEVNFDFQVFFSEVFQCKGGFDVIVANPPYVGEKGHKETFIEIKQGALREFYQSKMDLFYFFFHLALNLCRQGGNIAFITTNYYPTASRARNLRIDFFNRATIRHLINLGELKIFESALGQHNMITILSKSNSKAAMANNSITKRKGMATPEILDNILSWSDEETEYYQVPQNDLYDGTEHYIRLTGFKSSNNPVQSILSKLSTQVELLGDRICHVNKGVITGCDKVTEKHIQKYKLGNNYQKGEGVFILEKSTMDRFSREELSRIKPWFKNSDIAKYHTKTDAELFMIDICYPADKHIDHTQIPNIMNHLSKFKRILENRKTTANGLDKVIKKGYWWPLESKRKLDFEGPKVVCPQRSNSNTFAYNETAWYASADVYFITQTDQTISLKYILALLNSRLYYLWLYHRGKRKGEMLELYQQPLSEIPIKRISEEKQRPFIKLVDRILAAKNRDPKADTTAWEREIDRLVYELYGLTEEEIAIVEGAAK
jgi:type I restriction-modification system DNA methylase subunit